MIAGFSGSRDGMTEAQQVAVLRLLMDLQPAEFHHGAGPGRGRNLSADAQAVALARALGIWTVAHPGPIGVAEGVPDSHETHEPAGWLARDRAIAVAVGADPEGVLIAAPKTMPAAPRSGTATTARYAVQEGARVIWVAPDGTVTP